MFLCVLDEPFGSPMVDQEPLLTQNLYVSLENRNKNIQSMTKPPSMVSNVPSSIGSNNPRPSNYLAGITYHHKKRAELELRAARAQLSSDL